MTTCCTILRTVHNCSLWQMDRYYSRSVVGDDGERVVGPHSSSGTLSFSCCCHTALPLLAVLPHSGGIYPINRKKTSCFTYVLLTRHERGLDSK